MGRALYRQYRSKSLAEIIGQDHITQTLAQALKQGTISHAYLFTGPRGTGKTSIARILAHEVNQLPYSERPHLDIIEIDAASNRRIDEIRELKERAQIAPTSAKHKVYIIDEVHMLTKEAFNALLKTLEEPPAHVIFILATTEVHKVPETIISRTQRFTFKPVAATKVAEHLGAIAKQERIVIEPSALALLAELGEGSFRDSISLLDQVRHLEPPITLEEVRQAVGQAPTELLSQLIEALRAGSLPTLTEVIDHLLDDGIQAPQIAKQLAALVRHDLLAAEPLLPPQLSLQLLHHLSRVSLAPDPGLELELALYSVVLADKPPAAHEALTVPRQPTSNPVTTKKEAKPPKPQPQAPVDETDEPSHRHQSVSPLNESVWDEVLTALKAKHNTLYSISRMAQPTFGDNKLTLRFAFAFHQKRLEDAKNRELLMEIIRDVTGREVTIEGLLDPTIKPPAETVDTMPPIEPVGNPDLEAISNIFGSAEVVE